MSRPEIAIPYFEFSIVKLLRIIAAAAAAVIFLSCGNNPPEINQLDSQINLRRAPGAGDVTAELLVMLNCDDEDGDEDIEIIYVIDDGSSLLWTTDSNSWSVRNHRGTSWIGAERLMLPYGELPPPGRYRLIVTDRGGERAEGTIFVPLIKELPDAGLYPGLVFGEGDSLEVSSPEKNNIVSFYDLGGNLLGAFSISPGSLKIRDLSDGDRIFSEY